MDDLWPRWGAVEHWAKIERPVERPGGGQERLGAARKGLRDRFPVEDFQRARKALDPHNVLGGEMLDALLAREEE